MTNSKHVPISTENVLCKKWKDTFKILAFISVLLEITTYMPQQTILICGFQFQEHIRSIKNTQHISSALKTVMPILMTYCTHYKM